MNTTYLSSMLLGVLVVHALTEQAHGQSANGPAVVVRLSEGFVREQLNRTIRKVDPVDSTILGTRAIGRADTEARLEVSLTPSPSGVSLKLVIIGQTNALTQSDKGPIVFSSEAQTDFRAETNLFVEADGSFFLAPIQISGTTNSKTNHIRSKRVMMGRMVRRIASRRIEELRPAANEIANRQALEQIAIGLKEELTGELQRAAGALLKNRGLSRYLNIDLVDSMHLHSTSDALVIAFHSRGLTPTDYPSGPIGDTGTISLRKFQFKSIVPNRSNLLGFVSQPLILFSETHLTTNPFGSRSWVSDPENQSECGPDQWLTLNIDTLLLLSKFDLLAEHTN